MSLEQIRQAKAELDHLGSCSRAGKTPEQLAEMDNKFYAAMDRLKGLRQQQEAALARRSAFRFPYADDGRIRKNY